VTGGSSLPCDETSRLNLQPNVFKLVESSYTGMFCFNVTDNLRDILQPFKYQEKCELGTG